MRSQLRQKIGSILEMSTSSFGRGLVATLTLTLAHAHALPKHQTPAEGATLSTTPHEVTIEFDDSLEPAFSSIAVK